MQDPCAVTPTRPPLPETEVGETEQPLRPTLCVPPVPTFVSMKGWLTLEEAGAYVRLCVPQVPLAQVVKVIELALLLVQ